MDPPATKNLGQNQDINCQSNSMMRVAQTSIGAHSEPTQGKHHRGQENRQDLQPDMESRCSSGIAIIKSYYEDCSGHNQEKGNGSNHGMTSN